ncbi:hypothetical protein FLAT13_01812 [Flavobacterium salmonis]|uniref:RHS repeat-associated core domain-containing protein n=1 Tax=Flavobacterium salmonis TaxID=2654844 RepID=A0A6V6YWB4_9FLAO|nr:hypothetical protein FLAT13_01812 [Flavobacterium salmonis]
MVTQGATVTTTDYLAGYQYENSALKFFPTAEGYVEPEASSYKYIFQYKDHLGNVRLSYDKTLAIKEESNYYSFGLKQEGYNTVKIGVENKYKYNGKELQDELGLNFYDYGARNYDPALGRWMNVDPLAEVSRRWSPYNYCYNNPVINVDPDGMKPESSQTANVYYDWDEGGYRTQDGKTATAEEALDESNWNPLTADIFNSYVQKKYGVSDNQIGDFAGKLFEKAFIRFGEMNFEKDANFEGVSERSTLSIPDAYADGEHFNYKQLMFVRYEKSIWWEVKARNKNVTLDKQIKGFIDGLADEFKYTATKTGAAFLAIVTTSNSRVTPDVYVYAKARGVAIQHWQAQYKMDNGTMHVDFGYKNSPATPPVFQFNWNPVKL